MVTIYDIAKCTGYSAPTISKALNGTGKLSQATREKIIAIAQSMGYELNMAAKTLATRKSNLIGVIYEDDKMRSGFEHPLFGGVLNILREQMEALGYDIVFLSRALRMSYIAHAKLRSVDGIVIINPHPDDFEHVCTLAAAGIPCVSTNDHISGICTIVTDNVQAGYEGAEYLVSRGHSRIAFLAGPMNHYSPAAVERYEGFCACLKKHGISPSKKLFEECELWDMQSGYDSFARLYGRTQDFSAVFAADDMLAFGILMYAEEHHIGIPKAFSLLGFDDDRVSAFCHPKLTTFRQDKEHIATATTKTLMNLIAGIPAPDIIHIPAKLIERSSVRSIR